MISDEEFDQLNSAVAQLLPLVLEQRPGKILDITANDVTWIWQTYTSSGDRVNHPNGLIGTPSFMPAFPVGNADISTIVTPVEAWFRKRLTSTELGPVYEFDANCCPPPTVSGSPGCCDGTTPDTIPLTVSGTGDDCGDCFPFDVDLVFNSDSQHWKGQHDCTFGYCTVSFHFMLQCYPCDTPPPVPDFIPDCDGFDYYYILTYWVTTSGTDCPPSQVGVLTWNNSEVTCDPFTLSDKPLNIDLGIDCEIHVHSGSTPPFDCPSSIFANISGTCMDTQSVEMPWDGSEWYDTGLFVPTGQLGQVRVRAKWVNISPANCTYLGLPRNWQLVAEYTYECLVEPTFTVNWCTSGPCIVPANVALFGERDPTCSGCSVMSSDQVVLSL